MTLYTCSFVSTCSECTGTVPDTVPLLNIEYVFPTHLNMVLPYLGATCRMQYPNMRLAKCKHNKYLCCESQPHTHTHPVTPTHAHTHMHICVYTQEGFSPLHNTSAEGYDGIVEMLLQAGATVDLQTKVKDCDLTLLISHVLCSLYTTTQYSRQTGNMSSTQPVANAI